MQEMKQKSMFMRLYVAFPEFRQKQKLIDYYVGFEFPEKQGRLIDWWKKVISFIIEETGQTFVTYQDLVDLVTVEGLKPTPLKNMLNYLKNNHFLAAEPSLEQLAKEKALQAQQSQGGSWIKSLIGKVWGQSEQLEPNTFKFDAKQKIFSVRCLYVKKQAILNALSLIYKHFEVNALNESIIIEQLSRHNIYDAQSCHYALQDLSYQKHINIIPHRNGPIIIYSRSASDLSSTEWNHIELAKHMLRQQEDVLRSMIEKNIKRQGELIGQAKTYVLQGNKEAAAMLLAEKVQLQRKAKSMDTNRNILQSKRNYLELNEINKQTIELAESVDITISKTMVQSAKVEQIAQRNREMRQDMQLVNEHLSNMVEDDEKEDVQQMMREIQDEIVNEKGKNSMNRKLVVQQNRQQDEKLVIE